MFGSGSFGNSLFGNDRTTPVKAQHANCNDTSAEGAQATNTSIVEAVRGSTPVRAGERIRIVFLLQTAATWTSWKSVWEACRDHPDVTAYVVVTPYLHQYGSLSFYDECRYLLERERVPYFHERSFDLKTCPPHVVFVQNPYRDTRPDHLSMEELRGIGARVAYVPYGLEIGGGGENLRYQFNLDTQQQAWRIFARSERHRGMFARYCDAGSGHVVVTGHPKLDAVAKSAESPGGTNFKEMAGQRRVVLWTPHFSVGQEAQWSTYELFAEAIFDWFKRHKDMFLIFRPHPLFFGAMRRSGLMSAEEEEEFRRHFTFATNMALDEDPNYLGSFAAADALMTDAGSFLLEFLPTLKPILYLSDPAGYGLSEEGDVVENYYQASDPGDLIAFLSMFASGVDPMRDRRAAAIDEFLYGARDGLSGERICQHIVEAVRAGDDVSPASRPTAAPANVTAYWQNAPTTFLGPAEYYDRQEEQLRRLQGRLGPVGRVLDIGCGSGRFTMVLAEAAEAVTAFDVAPELVEQARVAADSAGLSNIEFHIGDAMAWSSHGTYDLVTCMGVTSSLIDDPDMSSFLDRLAAQVKKTGFLIVKDTLSTAGARTVETPGGYCAVYRNVHEYFDAFARRGFLVQERIELARDPEQNVVNYICLLRTGEQ